MEDYRDLANGPLDGRVNFVFVTCCPVTGGARVALSDRRKRGPIGTVTALETEAIRVRDGRTGAKAAGRPLPYSKRWPGCERFLGLTVTARKKLVNLMSITPDSFTAAMVPSEVSRRLRSCVGPSVRDQIVERLIEWWDRQVVLSLLGKRSRRIQKLELQRRITDLVVEHSQEGLPDSYTHKCRRLSRR